MAPRRADDHLAEAVLDRLEQMTPPHGTPVVQAEPNGIPRWLVPILVTIVGGLIATAGALATTSFKADAAYKTATEDHDTITKLNALVPKLEHAVERFERHVDEGDARKAAGK